jgi:hypothetical protein
MSFVGYWRPANPSPDYQGPHLLRIHLAGDHFVLDFPPVVISSPMVVSGDRLFLHMFQNGKEIDRWAFWLSRGGKKLFVGDYFGPPFKAKPQFVMAFKPATGQVAALATELHGWAANWTIQQQVSTLMNAPFFRTYYSRFGRYPPRSALLLGGAFWKSKHAPHLTNAVTGQPMRLGKGPGNFDYTTNATGSGYRISVHLYGGGDSTQAENMGL